MNTVGIIGAGSFGITLVKILSRNIDVIIYSRNDITVASINQTGAHLGHELRSNVRATNDISEITSQCELLFAVVPSSDSDK
ncbi:MAG: NAD(P)-binding domain-containing protein [Saprospiraceae bacterium]|nr:NAD(P)-binding domain-containing protein [Saprospiraceae bacterium]